jgi:hypothetical protein
MPSFLYLALRRIFAASNAALLETISDGEHGVKRLPSPSVVRRYSGLSTYRS